MKRLILFVLILGSITQLSAQELKLLGSYSYTNLNDKYDSYSNYDNTFGFGFGYNHFVKSQNKLGFIFYHSFNLTNYKNSHYLHTDGQNHLISKTYNNQRLTISINYAINIFKGEKSNFYIGPEIGLNYFKIDINSKFTKTNDPSFNLEYNSTKWYMHKLGLGFLIEYERLISNNISLSLSSHPEMVLYSSNGLESGSTHPFVPWISFNLGVQYKLSD